MSSRVDVQNKKYGLISILSATLIAISITLVLILLFAVVIRFFNVSDSLIFPINQVIKIISLIFGAIILLKKHKNKGFLKGLLLGIVYFISSYIVFSVLQNSFSFDMSNFYDLILTTIMGGLIGIIVVNIGKR